MAALSDAKLRRCKINQKYSATLRRFAPRAAFRRSDYVSNARHEYNPLCDSLRSPQFFTARVKITTRWPAPDEAEIGGGPEVADTGMVVDQANFNGRM